MSEQLETKLDYSGQTDFYNPFTHRGAVTVVGAGGIGSPTIIGLARLGVPKINVFDDDEVEAKNVTCQNFRKSDIGKPKVDVIAEMAKEVSSCDINPFMCRTDSKTILSGDIVISAVDSMKSRKEIYEAADNSPSVKWLIDGRLGGELIICHAINIRDKEQVEYYLSKDVMFEDSEMVSNSCTARHVADVGFAVAALMIRNVRRILTGQEVERLQTLNMNSLRLDTY